MATNIHIQALRDLRAVSVDHRRRLVKALAAPNGDRGGAQDSREVLINVQRTIETIDRALADEILAQESLAMPA